MPVPSIGGQALKRMFRAGLESLSQDVELINMHNVFPVPDGDTGINMYHTLKRAYQEIDQLESDDISVIAQRFAHGALMGARGNSGTILSQLLKGFADGLGESPILIPSLLRSACQAAVKQGYASVSQPTEGTILTVAREASESLSLRHSENVSLRMMLKSLIRAARASLENTPNLLPILKDAGVVDAGGMGLVSLLRGMAGGRARWRAGRPKTGGDIPTAVEGAESFGYDVQFLMIGEGLDVARTRRDLEELGWSVIVAGDQATIKVHIHADNPAVPLDYAIKSSAALDDVVVENMELQHQRHLSSVRRGSAQIDALSSDVAVIAVAEGDGLHAVFHSLNCSRVISGGASRNPAAEDFINAIKSLASNCVIILPNNRNIVLAAQQAADLAVDRQVKVLATDNVLQGIGAMLAFGDASDSGADLEAALAQMTAASAEIRSIEITQAVRNTRFRELSINQGDYIAIVDGEIRSAAEEIETAVLEAFSSFDIEDAELVTVYYGAGVSGVESEQLIKRIRLTVAGLECESIYGGQPLYPFLISVE